MPEIRGEVIVFLSAILTGVIVRLSYRCISCFRQIIKHSYFAMGIEDLIFWVSCAFYVFVQIYYTSSGSIRWYFVLGIVLGVCFCSEVLRGIEKTVKKIYARFKTYFH